MEKLSINQMENVSGGFSLSALWGERCGTCYAAVGTAMSAEAVLAAVLSGSIGGPMTVGAAVLILFGSAFVANAACNDCVSQLLSE